MDAVIKRDDFEDGMRDVQGTLSTMTDADTFFKDPVVLFLRDGSTPEVAVGLAKLQDERIAAKILEHWEKKELCVYCVVNCTEMIVLPIGVDVPMQI